MRKKLAFTLLALVLVLSASCRVNGSPFYRVLVSHEAKGHIEKNYGGGLSVGEVTYHGEGKEYRIKVTDNDGAVSDFSYFPNKNLLSDGYFQDCLKVWSLLRRAEVLSLLHGIPVEEVFVSYDFAEYGVIAQPSRGKIFISVLLEEQFEKENFSLVVFKAVEKLQGISDLAGINVSAAYRGSFLQYKHKPETGKITLTKAQRGTKLCSASPFPKP